MRWTFAVGPASGATPTRFLTAATGVRVTFRVDAAADAQFSMPGAHDELAGFIRLGMDLWIYAREQPDVEAELMFRGRIWSDQGTIDANRHTVQFSAIDYRGMLSRRVVGPQGAAWGTWDADGNVTGTVDQAEITWGLIAQSQALTAGDWAITNGLGASSSTNRALRLDPGKPIGEAIGELGRLANGYEWEVSPALELNRWYPRRGDDHGLVLDQGGTVIGLTYSFNGDDFGNAGLVTGDPNTVPVPFETVAIGADPRGRLERAQGFPTISEQDTLDARGPWYLDQIQQVRPTLRMTFRPRQWNADKAMFIGGWPGRAQCWIGDTVYPVVRDGWIQRTGTTHRIVELQVVPDMEDGEAVSVALLAIGETDELTPWPGTGLGGHGGGGGPEGPGDDPYAGLSLIVDEAGNPIVDESGNPTVWEQ